MQFWFVISLIFSVFVAVFAVQNSDIVRIDLFWYDWELSQSLVILASAVLGAVIAIFLGLFGRIRSGLRNRELANQLKAAEKKIELLGNSLRACEEKAAAAAVKAGTATAPEGDRPADPAGGDSL